MQENTQEQSLQQVVQHDISKLARLANLTMDGSLALSD